MKVLIIANDESTIINFRTEVIQAFADRHYEVILCCPRGERSAELEKIGCKIINIRVSRHGKNPFQDLGLLWTCKRLIKANKPDIVLTYTIKPNIYGSIACQKTNTEYINNITGLGSALQSKNFLSSLILRLQKYAYKKSSCVFFQNEENRNRFLKDKVITEETPYVILPGSGVNLVKQAAEDYPDDDGTTRFIMVSRIRGDKGFKEYFDVAEKVKTKYPNTEFWVAGGCEEESLVVRMRELVDKNIIVYHGKKTQEQVHALIAKCNCLVHPSYHEGMANVLLEAAACARPVIATNIPGCRETFDENVTGFGCKVMDEDSLEEAVVRFLGLTYDERKRMGLRGRQKMEKQFDRNIVADEYIKQIEKISLGRARNVALRRNQG